MIPCTGQGQFSYQIHTQNTALLRFPDIPIETFYCFPSVSRVQYLQDSIHINHCLLRIYVRLSTSQRVTFYGVQGSSPRCCSRFLTSDSSRY